MNEFTTIADRFEIEALRGEFSDAGMARDYDRFASLFTRDGAWRMPHINQEFVGRGQIREAIEQLRGMWEYAVQNPHPGTIQLDGDTASGRSYVSELGEMRDGRSLVNYGVYHDRYARTPDGWKFAERSYEVQYLDATPLTGSAPKVGGRP
jgi:ketosteroid isomerase-like protein